MQLLQIVVLSVDPQSPGVVFPLELIIQQNKKTNHRSRESIEDGSDRFAYHDVVAAVFEDGGGGAVGAAEAAEMGEDPYPPVCEIDGRLHPAMAAGGPLLMDLAPVVRPDLAASLIAELVLVICELAAINGEALFSPLKAVTRWRNWRSREEEQCLLTDFLRGSKGRLQEEK